MARDDIQILNKALPEANRIKDVNSPTPEPPLELFVFCKQTILANGAVVHLLFLRRSFK